MLLHGLRPLRDESVPSQRRRAAAAFAVVALACAPSAARAQEVDTLEAFEPFVARVAAVNRELERTLSTVGESVRARPRREVAREVIDSFPIETRDAALYFALGNMLYAHHFDLSYAMHRTAWEMDRGNPYVELEWALQQQRAGDCEGALAAYRIALAFPVPDSGSKSRFGECRGCRE